MPFLRIRRHQYIFFNVLFIGLVRYVFPFLRMYHTLWMGQTSGSADNDRRVIFFTVCKRKLGENAGFFAVGRLQYRNHCRTCNHAGVLLVLGTVNAGVVRSNQYQTAVYAGIGNRIQRVGSYIDTDQFHRSHCPCTGDRGTDCHFHSHLFIGWPFCIDFRIFCDTFAYFSARRTRIGSRNLDTSFIGSLCNGGIAKHDFWILQQIFPSFEWFLPYRL